MDSHLWYGQPPVLWTEYHLCLLLLQDSDDEPLSNRRPPNLTSPKLRRIFSSDAAMAAAGVKVGGW
jgi:hypothetical protein